jgi:hypothetical protein
VTSDDLFEDVPALFGLLHLKQTFGVMDFDLGDFVDFQALVGSFHDLFDVQAVGEGVSCPGVVVDHFDEGDVGFGLSVELLQHLLCEFDGDGPVL